MWALGLRGTAQQLPGMCPAVPCTPVLPGMGQEQLQQATFGILPAGAGAGAPPCQKAPGAVCPGRNGKPMGAKLGKEDSKSKRRQAPTLFFHSWLFLLAVSPQHGIHSTPGTTGPWERGVM